MVAAALTVAPNALPALQVLVGGGRLTVRAPERPAVALSFPQQDGKIIMAPGGEGAG